MKSIASDFSIFTMAPAASCAADPARTKTSKDVIRNLRIISICSHHLFLDKQTQSRCEQVVRGAKAMHGVRGERGNSHGSSNQNSTRYTTKRKPRRLMM